MENRTKHVSISIIYWITQITFWLYVAGALLLLLLAFSLIFSISNNTLDLHVGLPVAFDALEKGKLNLIGNSIEIEFMEAYGKVRFSQIPEVLGRVYGIFMLVVAGIFFYIFFCFRKFIKNVYRGMIFDADNFILLRRMAYALLIFWVIMVAYSVSQNFLIAHHMVFKTIELNGSIQYHGEVALAALFLLMLSQIFLHGSKLKEETDLTI